MSPRTPQSLIFHICETGTTRGPKCQSTKTEWLSQSWNAILPVMSLIALGLSADHSGPETAQLLNGENSVTEALRLWELRYEGGGVQQGLHAVHQESQVLLYRSSGKGHALLSSGSSGDRVYPHAHLCHVARWEIRHTE